MFILKKGHQPGVYVPLRAPFLVVETFRGVPTQLPISQLLTTLVYHTWYQINAKTYEYYLMVRYANYLI